MKVKHLLLACALVATIELLASFHTTKAREETKLYWGAVAVCPDGAGLPVARKETRADAEAAVHKGGQTAQIANARFALPCETEAATFPDNLAALHCIKYAGLSVVREESFIGKGNDAIAIAYKKAKSPSVVKLADSGEIVRDVAGMPLVTKGFDAIDCTVQTEFSPQTPEAPRWRMPHYQ